MYPGLDHSLEENLERLRTAAGMGISRLFLSFHIPETDPAAFGATVQPLLRAAREWGMETVGDLVPGNPVPEELTALRLDDGFTGADIAGLQRKYPERKLVLNASAVKGEQLQELAREGVDFSRVEALHNFYPHPHTGLSEGYLLRQNQLFHRFGIPVGAFVASQAGRRGPLWEGLPTLEQDRQRSVSLAARQLAALGTDGVYIGDDGPDRQELEALARVSGEVLELTLQVGESRPLYKILGGHVYETRTDEAEEVIRTVNSRTLWKEVEIPEFPFRRCHAGDVTLDNLRYGRYAGELEICLTELPADRRVDELIFAPSTILRP